MKEIKIKDCIFCGTGFTPFKTTQRVCSTRCAMGYAQEKEAKKEKPLPKLDPQQAWEDEFEF